MKPMCLLIAAGTMWLATTAGASAFPPYGYGYAYRPGPFVPRFGYGYGYRPYGFRRRLPNGTGYRGRGTFTGGPAGGFPNRN